MTFSDYLKLTFGSKVYRLALSTGCTCPNRDGTAGFGGCTFCSAGGSGDFAESGDIPDQLAKAKLRVEGKFPKTPGTERKYIAYFQSFSNTYVNDFSDNAGILGADSGNSLADAGNSLADTGKAMAGAGNSLADAAQAVSGAGNSVASAAQAVSGAGSSVAGAGSSVMDTGKALSAAAQTVSGAGKSLADTGKALSGAAQAVSGAGNSVADTGKALSSAAQVVSGTGETLSAAGNSLADAAQAVSGAGNSLADTGKAVSCTGSSLACTPPARNGVSFSALEAMFRTAIEQPEIVALSIGTRPDCLDNRMIQLLAELNRIKPVWVELGLQTIHEKTAVRINRGYPLEVFLDTWERLKAAGLSGIVHLIFGLPGETEEDMLESAAFLGKLQPAPDGVKFANLQILRGTKTADEFAEHPEDFLCFNMEDYACFLEQAVSLLAPQTVVHRLTGDGPKALLIEPKWSADKKRVLNCLKSHGLL